MCIKPRNNNPWASSFLANLHPLRGIQMQAAGLLGNHTHPPGGATAIVLAMLLSAGCVVTPGGPEGSFGLDFHMPSGSTIDGALVFVVDGLNAEIFQEMLDAGQLPAIGKHLASRGLYATRAVANTPSVTLANLTSLATGRFPGHHGVTGINWFDRNRLVWRNYDTIAQKNTLDGDYTAATIYELLPGRTTFSVFFQPHRGATKFIENSSSAGPIFFFGWYEWVDRLTLYRLNIVADVARKRGHWPAVTICYLLAPDFRAYQHGVDSPEYREALRHTDRQIGRVLGDMERAGVLDKLVIALVSDHSLIEVTKHFPMDRFLRDKVGLNVASSRLWENTPFERRLDYYRNFSAVTYGSGDRYWAICLRKPARDSAGGGRFEPWTVRPGADDLKRYPVRTAAAAPFPLQWIRRPASPRPQTADLLALLAGHESVDAVAYAAGPGRVSVRRRKGEVEFRQDAGPGTPISYHLISGEEPFGWRERVPPEALAGAPMTPRQWLACTIDTDYPDLPAQIVAYFRARRAGDIAVFAAPGWDFNKVNRAGHGGLGPQDMLTPLLLAGPQIPHKRIPTARTVDLVPTLLRLLGRPVPAGLDGESLVEIFTAGAPGSYEGR
ncbi:MAG: alkaline phosphatase family protein [Phycisphaerae bacterium]|nr:alkaline phosphatase family protein [Phycisphaerae bacterium]